MKMQRKIRPPPSLRKTRNCDGCCISCDSSLGVCALLWDFIPTASINFACAEQKKTDMAPAWKEYQERVASFFRSLGIDAATDVTVTGVRTTHDVDVVVKSHQIGFEIIWLIECKHWKARVSKLHVLALREIVADVGADRGILLSEVGFQSGAIEAANLTNVRVTSLAELNVTAANEFHAMRLRDLYSQVEQCSDRYWEIPKQERIEHGLRFDIADEPLSYSGNQVITACRDLLSRAFRGLYPFRLETLAPIHLNELQEGEFNSALEVISVVEPMLSDLERRLDAYHKAKQY